MFYEWIIWNVCCRCRTWSSSWWLWRALACELMTMLPILFVTSHEWRTTNADSFYWLQYCWWRAGIIIIIRQSNVYVRCWLLLFICTVCVCFYWLRWRTFCWSVVDVSVAVASLDHRWRVILLDLLSVKQSSLMLQPMFCCCVELGPANWIKNQIACYD